MFAFGPASNVERMSAQNAFDFSKYATAERVLRSPINWLHGISSPTYLVEAKDDVGYRRDVERLCAKTRNPQVHCILAGGETRFSALSKVSTVIAARLAISDSRDFSIRPEEFQ